MSQHRALPSTNGELSSKADAKDWVAIPTQQAYKGQSAALELVGARKHALAPSSGHRPKYSRTVTQTQGFLGVKVSPEVL